MEFKKEYSRNSKVVWLLVLSLLIYLILIDILMYFEKDASDSAIDNFWDAIWYSLVTLTTVGYGDLVPVTLGGRVVGIVFIFLSVGFYGLVLGQINSFIINYREHRMLGYNGTKFFGHTVIIGWNSFGRAVTDQLVGVGKKVVVVTNIKNDVELINEIYEPKDVFTLFSDFNNIELLKKSNLQESNMVFVNLENDTEKLVFILNLKKSFVDLNYVVTLDNSNLKKTFQSAGVTHAISKDEIASKLLASYIFEPDVATFSEEIMSFTESDDDFDIKQYKISSRFGFLQRSYGEVFEILRNEYDVLAVGISKWDPSSLKRTLIKNASRQTIIQEGDYLILLVDGKSVAKMKSFFGQDEGYFS